MNTNWNVGVARCDITPKEPIALAGWGGKDRVTKEAVHPLWAKAIALQDANGALAVLVTTDLLGLSRGMSEELAARAQKLGLQRHQLIINSSHNHAGPVTGDLLHLYYELNASESGAVQRYTLELLDKIEAVIAESLQSLEPAALSFNQGLCGFGVNRRRDLSRGEYSKVRSLSQVVDQDVPVLVVRGRDDQVRAIVFGYACHPTSYNILQLCGDWPGFAQIEIEKQFPQATAMFVAGCGGDINPLPRFGNFHEELPVMFGRILAASVSNVLDDKMQPIDSVLTTAFKEIDLQLVTPPNAAQLQERRAAALKASGDSIRVREVDFQLKLLEEGALTQSVPYPIHVWRLGALRFIGLSGEPVVDYSLRFKAEYDVQYTWTAGYCNELTSYVPSLRVLREGGYEGTDGMMEYGWPATYDESVEERIAGAVADLMKTQ